MLFLLSFGALPFGLILLSVLPQLRRLPCWPPILGVSALVGAGCFLYVQTVLNSPDVGMEFQQFCLPLLIYGLVFAAGIVFAAGRKKAAN